MSSVPDVPLRWVDKLGSVPRAERRPGDAKWATHPHPDQRGLLFCCACGCGDVVHVTLSSKGLTQTAGGLPCWTWDGDTEAPTLSPSVQYSGPCRWHGWLRRGVLRTA